MQEQTADQTRKNKSVNYKSSSDEIIKPDKAYQSFSVSDLNEALEFYQDTLGLNAEKGDMGNLTLRLGQNEIFIYEKDNHEPATFTILNFPVDDIEAAVDNLSKRGVKFEKYEGDIQTDERGVFRHGPSGVEMAWFKDPSGNIMSVIKES